MNLTCYESDDEVYFSFSLLESTVSSIDLHMRNGKDEIDATQMSTVQAVKAAEVRV